MKSFFAVTALAGLAAAQTISSLPKCGVSDQLALPSFTD
jgi:hypothetical protein